ncbi:MULTISPECIES: hypothetical protein [Brucella]|uniref:Uncharacterized protein n=1 Tax=Brucella daejeonensis TaxID=659015 RepID=A0A7W9B1P4_9HYPH|nr:MULTISPECIES: hypothetical protein [Brucella]MBB5704619.1 hypothetical protein [Brucella daejeonensis]NKB79553.1 hypothetical protein [Brucella daejeonensis]
MVRLRDNLAIAFNGSMNPLKIKEFFQKAQPCTAFQVRLAALRDILQQATNEQKSLPAEITVTKPATVLDEIALTLFKEPLASIPGAPPVRILDHGRQ